MVKRSITVNTVQGIGDIFWVYQKLVPYYFPVNLNIYCVDVHSVVQVRAKEFCSMLPGVGRVSYQQVSSAEYSRIAALHCRMKELDRDRRPLDYAVNAPLEMGINIRDIDPGYKIEEFVDLGLPSTVKSDGSLCVFVAGAKGNQVWNSAQWLTAIKCVASKLRVDRINLIGASWDVDAQREIQECLNGYQVDSHVGTTGLVGTVGVIRSSKFFLGFQSGLSVIADNYDVPQLMMYFAKLRPMMYTWCRPKNIDTIFNAATFDEDINQIVDRCVMC